MGEAAITYEIRTVDDFRKVPLDRLDACLAEFPLFLEAQRHMRVILGDIEGVSVFRWCDDDAPGITNVVIGTKEGPIATFDKDGIHMSPAPPQRET